ncbi:MAG: hypothetical protein ACOZAK_03310 [Patescibacteria group bacterium]
MITAEAVIIPQEKITRVVFDLAVRLRSFENIELAPIVLLVLENIKDPKTSFEDLEPAQQLLVVNFLIEMLPQIDISSYQTK